MLAGGVASDACTAAPPSTPRQVQGQPRPLTGRRQSIHCSRPVLSPAPRGHHAIQPRPPRPALLRHARTPPAAPDSPAPTVHQSKHRAPPRPITMDTQPACRSHTPASPRVCRPPRPGMPHHGIFPPCALPCSTPLSCELYVSFRFRLQLMWFYWDFT